MVRGLGGSELTSSAVRALTAGKTVHLTLFWGFRALDPTEPGLNAAEANTLRAHVAMARALGEHCNPVLLLADAHAVHNGIPQTIWKPYYDAVAQLAAELGVRTIMLSSILTTLGIASTALAEHGRALVLRPGAPRQTGVYVLSGDQWCQLKLQSRHLCERFPQVFTKPVGAAAKNKLYEPRALAYIRLRAAEGCFLLPVMKTFFNGDAVLPVHVSDPATEQMGVYGLHIYGMDGQNQPQKSIPWR